MKLILLFFILTSSTFASIDLKPYHCLPIVSSKKYIQNNFEAPYPKDVIFSCEYFCRNENNVSKIQGVSKIRVERVTDDAKKVVCEGVKVKKVAWGWDFAGTESFYAHSTMIKEIKVWASKNITRDNPYEVDLLIRLRSTLLEVSNSYFQIRMSGFEYYEEAARELNKIAMGLPQNTKELDTYLANIPSELDMQTKEGLIYGVLKSAAAFRIKK